MNEENVSTVNTADMQTKASKPKRTDSDKLRDFYEKRNKLTEQQTAVRKKSKAIDKGIAETNAKIAELEYKELLKICKQKKITTQKLIAFLKEIPENANLNDVANRAFHRMNYHSEQMKFGNI